MIDTISKRLLTLLCLFLTMAALWSCSEEDDEEAEYPSNWREINEAYFAALSDSVIALTAEDPNRTDWFRLKKWSLDENIVTDSTDYIIVNVIEAGTGTEYPLFTDSVEVSYSGRLLPSLSYPNGYVFDRTYYGDYDAETSASSSFAVGNSSGTSLIDGFATAVQHMVIGDHWVIYIPYQLGYGTSGSSSIPGYSTLIFELVLQDFWPEE